MTKLKIAISDGHGYLTAGKRTPDNFHENYFNEATVNFLYAELIRCGFDVLKVAPTTADTPLKERTDHANSWGADAYVAVHYNALGSTWRTGQGGIETYYYPNSVKGKELATSIHNQLIKGTPLLNRGVKSGNLHEVREPKAPAALAECGFMDIKHEVDLMKSAAYQKECAVEICKGICDYFKVSYVPEVASAPHGATIIGYATVKAEQLNIRQTADLNSKVVGTLAKGKKVAVYSINGNWYNVGNGWISNSGGKYATYEVKPIPVPIKPTAPAKPAEPSKTVYRVYVDNVQVGAYSEDSNIVARTKEAIAKGAKNVRLEKVS